MPQSKILIEISEGVLQSVYWNNRGEAPEVLLVDHDEGKEDEEVEQENEELLELVEKEEWKTIF